MRTPAPSSMRVAGIRSSYKATGAAQTRSQSRSPTSSVDDSVGLRVLTLNIGAAAATRAGAILEWLDTRHEDVLVLTETSSGPGTQLLVHALRDRGYEVRATFGDRDRGALVASRLAVRDVPGPHLDVTLPWRVATVMLEGLVPVTILGVYVPSRDRTPMKIERKRAFIESLLRGVKALPRAIRERMLIVGDYNTVARRHVPALPGFFPYEYDLHDQLEALGFCSAHELGDNDTHPHSWIGRTGTGYLYDYAHVGDALHRDVERCTYVHAPRELRISDHAAVALRLRPST
jgi:exodeoxyribonuclease-3